MRQETQEWNDLRVLAEIVVGGVGQTGLTVRALVKRLSDGYYYNGTIFQASVPGTVPAMTAVDATNYPGVYQLSIASGAVTYDSGFPGYLVRINETTTPLLEHLLITPQRRAAWDDLMADHVGAGTQGNFFRRMLALRQDNVRVVYDLWTSDRQPKHGFVYIYDSKANLEADTSPYPLAIGKYEIDAAYDGSLRCTEYTSTRET